MWCSEHQERLYEPIGGEPFCLGRAVDRIVAHLALSEEVEECFRAWAYDGADRDDEHDALERHTRAVRLCDEPAAVLAAFRRAHPDVVRNEAVRKAQDLLLFLGFSEKATRGRLDRVGFQIAQNRTRDLIALLEAA